MLGENVKGDSLAHTQANSGSTNDFIPDFLEQQLIVNTGLYGSCK